MQAQHPPADIASRIRALGTVIDMPATQALYQPLLAQQRRDGVDVLRNLAYGDGARHVLDIYRPQASAGPLPVLVFLHGGGFLRGDKIDRENAGQVFARAGYLAVVPNYRLAPADPWPAGAQDVAAVVAWLHRHVAAHGGDAGHIVLVGESAGATHVAAASLMRRFHPGDGSHGLGVRAAVLVSGVYNVQLEYLARRQLGIATPDVRNEAYFGKDPARYAAMSIVDLIDAPPVPLLITYAELDPPQMQVQAGELFARLVTRHGFHPELRVIPGHNHLTQVFSMNTGDESLTRRILDFLDALPLPDNLKQRAAMGASTADGGKRADGLAAPWQPAGTPSTRRAARPQHGNLMTKPFDLVVHGATGFTGRLVVEYLLQQYPNGGRVRWAMGGRSAEKLAAVRDELRAPADTPLVVTDSTDPASLQQLMAQTRLVLTTVGPYQLYGSELVAACANAGVDYVDLCGEPAWMRRMIDAHEPQARASGARIVFSCGFDSIPFDLGVLMLQNEMKRRFGSAADRVRGRVRKMKGRFSGGTAASLKATMAAAQQDPGVLALLRNPFSLTPGFEGPPQPRGNKPMFEEAVGAWVAPFVMADINTRNVHRSNFLLGHPWGQDFVYDEMLITGEGKKGEAVAHAVAADKSMMSDDGPKPGEGPSRAEREAGSYDVLFLGTDAAGNSARVSAKGDMDPGYGSTSKMITEAAVCLLQEVTAVAGGMWTPSSAMGGRLIERLGEHAGLAFTVEP